MRGPVVTGLIGACIVLAIVGLIRAISEFGNAGLVAYLELLLGPAALVLIFIVYAPRFEGGRLFGLVPSDTALRRAAIGVLIVTGLLLASAGTLGVGWLVSH